MAVTITDRQPDETSHTRYALIFPDYVALACIGNVIDNLEEPGLTGIVILASDGTSELVNIEKNAVDGNWIVTVGDGSPDNVVEEIRYAEHDEEVIEFHEVYVPGFTTDTLPAAPTSH